jgi:hypothetical protein
MSIFVKSQRGFNMISDSEGFRYNKHKTLANDNVVWRCESYRCGYCKVSIKTTGINSSVIIPGSKIGEPHTCQRKAWKTEDRQFREIIKRRAVITQENPSQIIAQALEGVSKEAQEKIKMNNLKRFVTFLLNEK